LIRFVPWQNVADWHCRACGYCCKLYSVVLNFPEWLTLTNTFGSETTVTGLNRFYIKRDSDGSCAFLCKYSHNYFCALQHMKPDACKVWPFKVLSEAKYGDPNKAAYTYRGYQLYVYADTMCSGLRYGEPTWDFRTATVKEFTELSLGLRQVQHNTTKTGFRYPQWIR